MSRPDEELRQVLARGAGDRRRSQPHLSPEELAEYHAGAESPEGEARIQDHLLWCPSCTTALLDLASFADPEAQLDEDDRVLPEETERAWQDLRRHLEREDGGRARPEPSPATAVPGRWPVPMVAVRRSLATGLAALAAGVLAAAVGLGIWAVQLRGTVEELTRPRANVPIRDLYPADATRSEGARHEELVLSRSVGFVTLVLNPSEWHPHDSYAAEIVRPDGHQVWVVEGLVRSRWNTFTLGLFTGSLAPGDYRIRLVGRNGAERELLDEYPLRIQPR